MGESALLNHSDMPNSIILNAQREEELEAFVVNLITHAVHTLLILSWPMECKKKKKFN